MASDQALRDLILASNPVGYYPLDTPANLGRDISPYANHGSQSGTFRQSVSTLAGMDFMMTQGVSSPLVSIPDRAEYKGRTLTIEFMAVITEDENTILAERGGDNQNWSLQVNGTIYGAPAGTLQFAVGPNTAQLNSRVTGPFPLCHIVCTSVLGVDSFYVNGNLLKKHTTATGSGIQGNQGTLPIHLFSRGGGALATKAWLAHMAFYNRELSVAEIQARDELFRELYEFKLQPITAIPANQETRAQFQPQDVAWVGGEGKGYAGPVNANPLDPDLLCAGLDRYWLRDGVQDVLQGYIESTVTINGEGVARRVLCFDQAGNLVGETMSRASDGKYRFDLLWLNRRYMLVAQDDPAFGPADYNAVAADFQLPTPYAPGEGVGLA
ncbi:LamG-like jellyroll fold domain-containing protein [Aeromonas caviae]|uniref:LamG-like jellyroll fold domain-containing protein n=1 Tax=Aeromonas caviae TaxID=648 RepID=UPI003F743634